LDAAIIDLRLNGIFSGEVADTLSLFREKRIENSMGRDMIYGIFGGHITSEGVTLTPPSAKPSLAKPD
jgi:hypothetical protein